MRPAAGRRRPENTEADQPHLCFFCFLMDTDLSHLNLLFLGSRRAGCPHLRQALSLGMRPFRKHISSISSRLVTASR